MKRLRPVHWAALDGAVAVMYGLGLAVVPKYVHVPLYPVGIAVVTLAIAVRRRYPLPALGVVLLVLFPAWTPIWAGVWVWTYVLYIIVVTHRPRTALVALAATLATMVAALLWTPHPMRNLVWSVAMPALIVTVVATIGYAIGRHRAYERALLAHRVGRAEAEMAAEAEKSRRGVTEERLRIARDLHDVVAHSMSVITVQAGFGHLVIDTQPEQARAALAIIETTGRQTLTEMRQLLGVLRAEADAEADAAGVDGVGGGADVGDRVGAALAPAPGLADLSQLVAQTGQAGLRVDLRIIGAPRELPPGVDTSAYRIVQEALTNVVKHAGTASGRVTIDYRPDELSIEVTDDGIGHSGGARANGPAGGSGGHGLLGMRERVSLYGGELSAGPLPGRGFRVHARLPLAAPDAGAASGVRA
jgi:signal transduction histidine kinase